MAQTNQTVIPPVMNSNTDLKLREAAKIKIIKRSLIQSHVSVFIVVNLILFIIDRFVDNSSASWYPWVLTGWGLGLAIHAFSYYASTMKLLGYHIFIYIVVTLYLVFIDWYPDQVLNWVLWPTIFWGFGLLGHIIFYNFFKPTANEDPNKSWIDRKIDAEMQSQSVNTPKGLCLKCRHQNVADAQFCSVCGENI